VWSGKSSFNLYIGGTNHTISLLQGLSRLLVGNMNNTVHPSALNSLSRPGSEGNDLGDEADIIYLRNFFETEPNRFLRVVASYIFIVSELQQTLAQIGVVRSEPQARRRTARLTIMHMNLTTSRNAGPSSEIIFNRGAIRHSITKRKTCQGGAKFNYL